MLITVSARSARRLQIDHHHLVLRRLPIANIQHCFCSLRLRLASEAPRSASRFSNNCSDCRRTWAVRKRTASKAQRNAHNAPANREQSAANRKRIATIHQEIALNRIEARAKSGDPRANREPTESYVRAIQILSDWTFGLARLARLVCRLHFS